MGKLKTRILVMIVVMFVVGIGITSSVTAWGVVNIWGYDHVGSVAASTVCLIVDSGCWTFDFATWKGWIKTISVRTLTGVCLAITGVCIVKAWVCSNAQIDVYRAKWWNPVRFSLMGEFLALPRCP